MNAREETNGNEEIRKQESNGEGERLGTGRGSERKRD